MTPDPPRHVLLTGFEPFAGDTANPSQELAKASGSVLVPPYDDARIIAGQGGPVRLVGIAETEPSLIAEAKRRIAEKPDDFYHGALARELAAAMQKGGGLITAEDLANYEVKEREPVRGTYRGYDVISAPPPSSGGVHLVEMLNILDERKFPADEVVVLDKLTSFGGRIDELSPTTVGAVLTSTARTTPM